MIAISFPTIQDGTVVRWYASAEAYVDRRTEVISASHGGVYAAGFITREQFDAAEAVALRLKADRNADVSDVITHTTSLFRRDLKPVPSQATDNSRSHP